MKALLNTVILVVDPCFSSLSILCQFLLNCKVSVEKLADGLMRVPLQLTNCYSLDAFRNSVFNHWHFNVLYGSFRDSSCFGLCASWICTSISFGRLGIFLNRFSILCSFSSSGIPMMRMLLCLMLSQRSHKLSFYIFYCSDWVFSVILFSKLLIQFSPSHNLLSTPSNVFFISGWLFSYFLPPFMFLC